jgi:dihydroorotate dehydrogenase
MERTAVTLGGIELGSSIANASGARSSERGEIYELCAVHNGALVLKSCNLAGLDAPESLKNPGVAHFAAIASELTARGKVVVGSAVGASEEELVAVAVVLEAAGVQIIELNLADDYVMNWVARFGSQERLKAVLGRVRDKIAAAIAVKIPQRLALEPGAIADVIRALRIAIVVCHNDLPQGLEVDLATGTARCAPRTLSRAHALYRESAGLFDVVAVGGVNSGRDAYIAHLAGAKVVQVGSAVVKEGPGALGRIDRELNAILVEQGKRSVNEIIGQIRFA